MEVWTKKSVVSLSSSIQSVVKNLGTEHGLNQHLEATASMCLVKCKGLGRAKHVDMQNLWIQEASKSKTVRHEEGGHEREPRRHDDETTIGTRDRAAYGNHGL